EDAVHPTSAANPEDAFGLVDEQKRELALGGAFAALREEVADLTLGFAHPHVQDLRPLDVEEELGAIDPGAFLDLLPQVPRRRLAKKRLAAPWRPVQEESLGHRVIEALEQIAPQERQFDRVTDRLHRLVLSPDGRPRKRVHRFKAPL